MLTHSAFSLKVGHPPTTRSTTTDKSLSNCFSSPVWGRQIHPSCLQTITSFLLLAAPMKEGGRVQERRNTSAQQSCTVGTTLTSCVLGPLGLGVWAPLSYNTVDKKPRAQPSGNLRGGVSRPGGQERGKEGQNISGTLHLRWPIFASKIVWIMWSRRATVD